MEANNLATITGNPYRLALISKKIVDMPKVEVMKEFLNIFSKMYFDSGQQIPENEYQKLLCNSWHQEVSTDFKFLRIDEMRLAFHNGIRKQYGEFFGLNIATFHIWVKGYLAEEKRKYELAKLKEENDAPPKPIMSESEAEYLWRQTIKKQFAHFKETGHLVIEFPSHVFERFEKLGLIKLTDEEKKPIYEQAKVKLCELKRLIRLNPKNRIEMNNATAFLNRVSTNQLTISDKQEIKSEARRIAIENFYNSITALNI